MTSPSDNDPTKKRDDTRAKVCGACGRGEGTGMGGILDRCSGCGKLIHRSCKKRVSYHQHCPLCNDDGWSVA